MMKSFFGIFKDIARYDRLREMSGDPPLRRGILNFFGAIFGDTTAPHGHESRTVVQNVLESDIMRYAKNKFM